MYWYIINMSLANLNDISTPVIIPSLQCCKISYNYQSQSGVPPIPSGNQLGSSISTSTAIDLTPVDGTADIQQLIYQITDVHPGTYLLFYNTTLDSVSGDVNTFPDMTDSETGAEIARGSQFFLTGTGSQYSTANGTFIFTSTTTFTASLYLNAGVGGGNTTPIDVGGLTLVRLA